MRFSTTVPSVALWVCTSWALAVTSTVSDCSPKTIPTFSVLTSVTVMVTSNGTTVLNPFAEN